MSMTTDFKAKGQLTSPEESQLTKTRDIPLFIIRSSYTLQDLFYDLPQARQPGLPT